VIINNLLKEHGERISMDKRLNAPARLLEHPRLEIIPTNQEDEEQKIAELPPNAKVAVVCPLDKRGKDGKFERGLDKTLRLTRLLASNRIQAVPHIAARSVKDEKHLEGILQNLNDWSVKDIFIPGGDKKDPAGIFSSSLQLLCKMNELGYIKNFDQIGVASYPEGHVDPKINSLLFESLEQKQRFATYTITQMSFKPERIAKWLVDMRQRDIVLPACVGVPGFVNKWDLLRISRKIGVGGSKSFLRRHPEFLRELYLNFSSFYNPEKILCGLAPYIENPNCNIQGFHIYTFNQVANTLWWINSITQNHKQEE
jgi:methylenetetrahydrofolate reductase (NADPH)